MDPVTLFLLPQNLTLLLMLMKGLSVLDEIRFELKTNFFYDLVFSISYNESVTFK